MFDTDGKLKIYHNGVAIFTGTTANYNTLWHTILISVDVLSGIANFYLDGVLQTTIVPTSTSTISLYYLYIGGHSVNVSYPFLGEISAVYFAVDNAIDFSQEANRNLFINQLGYIRNLSPLIDDGTIPTPLIYTKMEDTTNFGKNEYNTDMVPGGTVTAGSDFTL